MLSWLVITFLLRSKRLLISWFQSLVEEVLYMQQYTPKVHLVKAMVFPVVMYGSENWTVKKAEHEELILLSCGVGEDS